jgi:hypothetical protein
MPDPKFPKIPSNLDAIFKSASQITKIEGLVAPRIPPGVEAAFKALRAIPKVEALQVPQVDLSAFTEMRKNALTVFPEWQRQIAQQMQPMADLQRQMRQIALPPQSVIDQFNDAAKNIRSSFQFLVPSAEQLEIFKQLSELELQKRALERIGLLPHRSMPVSLLTEQDDDVLRSSLQQHYTENWERIGDGIRERVNSFDIDDEAKAVMAEALEAHRNGHYRSVCRLLLPEIERVARVEFEGNRAGPVNMKKVMVEPALDLPLSKTRLNVFRASPVRSPGRSPVRPCRREEPLTASARSGPESARGHSRHRRVPLVLEFAQRDFHDRFCLPAHGCHQGGLKAVRWAKLMPRLPAASTPHARCESAQSVLISDCGSQETILKEGQGIRLCDRQRALPEDQFRGGHRLFRDDEGQYCGCRKQGPHARRAPESDHQGLPEGITRNVRCNRR